MTGWSETLDAILPPPGIDLAFLDDPEAVADLTVKAMWGAAKRLRASTDDLELVLDLLLAETKS